MEPDSIQLERFHPPCVRNKLHRDFARSNSRQLPHPEVCFSRLLRCFRFCRCDAGLCRRIYFSDRLYSEEELPPEFKLFLPIQVGIFSAPVVTTQPRCVVLKILFALAEIVRADSAGAASKHATRRGVVDVARGLGG